MGCGTKVHENLELGIKVGEEELTKEEIKMLEKNMSCSFTTPTHDKDRQKLFQTNLKQFGASHTKEEIQKK